MTNIDEAQNIILERTRTMSEEELPLLQSLGRVIACDVHAPRDIPPHNNSGMDGYAFAIGGMQDNRLKVSGFLPAGEMIQGSVAPGEAVRIMTGAPVPSDCDTVVPIENVIDSGDFIEITGKIKPGANVRRQGEEFKAGDLAISGFTLLRPQEIGLLASFGHAAVPVIRRPRVAILATGDELSEPGSPLKPGGIYNSNSYSLAAQVLEAGAEPVLLGITADRPDTTREKMLAGVEYDMLITTGGVSTGDRDYVKETITELDGSILFWKVNMKPGKPFAFGVLKGKPVFALPGNPTASMISFELFVRPAILKMTGHLNIFRPAVIGMVIDTFKNKGDRPHVVSVNAKLRHGEYSIEAAGEQGSARISAMTAGNALVMIPPATTLTPGDRATAMLLSRER